MINILIIGSCAREHAIARAIKKSSRENKLFCYGNSFNPGIAELCEIMHVGSIKNNTDIVDFAKTHKIDFAIIGPEDPLSNGIVNDLEKHHIASIGPTQDLAQIETSKGFARDLLTRYNVPACPKYKWFGDMDGVREYLNKLGSDYVIKADGLMAGKGVKISGEQLHSHEDSLKYCNELISIGHPFVIEEKMIGPEFSLMSFSDGKHFAHMFPVQDHKRAFAGDLGPNTGGMGSYSDANHLLPFLSAEDIRVAEKINEITLHSLHETFGEQYKGILYGGFIVTRDGVKLIEYNARFGDPESINILALLKTDFVDLCEAIINGTLNNITVDFENKATVCKYVVPVGYPDEPLKDQQIDCSLIKDINKIFYANVKQDCDKIFTTGSRTIAVLGVGQSIFEAEKEAELLANSITGKIFHREDIGTSELINERIKLVNDVRNTQYKYL